MRRVKKRFNAVVFKSHRKEKFVLDRSEQTVMKSSKFGRASLALDFTGGNYTRKF